MQKMLLFVMMTAIWMVASCTPRMDNGCYGYWKDPGLKRGTLTKNQKTLTPYRQCVDKKAPHKNKEKRPYG